MRLLPCPKCGKYPKIFEGYEESKAICKPLFGNAHLIVYGSDTLDVVSEWNDEVTKYWNPDYKEKTWRQNED